MQLSDVNTFISKPQISCTLRMHPMNSEERRALFSHYGRFSMIKPKVCLWLPSAGEFHTVLKQMLSFFPVKRIHYFEWHLFLFISRNHKYNDLFAVGLGSRKFTIYQHIQAIICNLNSSEMCFIFSLQMNLLSRGVACFSSTPWKTQVTQNSSLTRPQE